MTVAKRIHGRATRDWNAIVQGRLAQAIEPRVTIQTVRDGNPRLFDDLVQRIRQAGTASIAVCGDDYEMEGGLWLQQRTNEFAALCVFLDGRDTQGAYLEIGTASGGACRFLQALLDSRQVLSLDEGRHRDAYLQDENLAGIPNLARYIGDSHADAAKEFIARNLTTPLAIAFIDGDHSYEGVLEDTRLVLTFARAGTLLVYHDTYAVPEVRRHWVLGASSGMFVPVAHFVDDRPGALGIGVAVAAAEGRVRSVLRALAKRP